MGQKKKRNEIEAQNKGKPTVYALEQDSPNSGKEKEEKPKAETPKATRKPSKSKQKEQTKPEASTTEYEAKVNVYGFVRIPKKMAQALNWSPSDQRGKLLAEEIPLTLTIDEDGSIAIRLR